MNRYDFYHKKEFDDNEKEYNKKIFEFADFSFRT